MSSLSEDGVTTSKATLCYRASKGVWIVFASVDRNTSGLVPQRKDVEVMVRCLEARDQRLGEFTLSAERLLELGPLVDKAVTGVLREAERWKYETTPPFGPGR